MPNLRGVSSAFIRIWQQSMAWLRMTTKSSSAFPGRGVRPQRELEVTDLVAEVTRARAQAHRRAAAATARARFFLEGLGLCHETRYLVPTILDIY